VANGNGKKKSRKWLIIGIVVAVVVVLGALGLYASSGTTKIDPTKLAKVERADLAKSVVATGKCSPSQRWSLSRRLAAL